MHLSILLNNKKHKIQTWIRSVCDKQDFSRPLETQQEVKDFIFWKDWRAPKLIYMQPSGNFPYDPSTAWNREDEAKTAELLEGLSSRFIQFLGFDLERIAGDAQVEIAKTAKLTRDVDRPFQQMAIEEALKSVAEDDRPHPKVGAVVVKNGKLLSKAHRGENPTSHAEYVALEQKLSDELTAGATVYTTLEPCTTRKHPKIPCAQRLVDRKVARVVIGMLDPNPDIRGRGVQLLRNL
jgi:pyrimidine deaminase RibD-like protein